MRRAPKRPHRAVGETADARRALEVLVPRCRCGSALRPGHRFCRPSCRAPRREPDLLDVEPDRFEDGEDEQ
jgi:hypothetical protein